jgi:tetratricopeptide (TPR) repeat protein
MKARDKRRHAAILPRDDQPATRLHGQGARSANLQVVLAPLIVFISVFVVFSAALKNQFVNWDDPDNFLLNENYRGLGWSNIKWMFTTFHMGHFQPLTWMTLALDSIWGRLFFNNAIDPRPYHFTNNLLHAVNAVLVYYVALRLMAAAKMRPEPTFAGLAALLFGVHPLRVESVAWVTERRDLLSGFFVLLTVLAYLQAVTGPSGSPTHRARWLAMAVVLFTFSLLSKVMGVTLPVVLLILDWFPLRRLGPTPADWLSKSARAVYAEKIPFFFLALVFSTVASIGQGTHDWLVPLSMHGPIHRCGQAMYGLVFYFFKTIAPTHLLPFYEMRFPLDLSEARFAISFVVVLMAAAAIVALFVRRRLPGVVAAATTYAVMLLPILGFVQNGQQIVADRYSYLPCIGWAILFAAGLMTLYRRVQTAARVGILCISVAGLAALSALTWKQTYVWRDTASLWTYLAKNDPNNSRGQTGYGYVLLQAGRVEEAIDRFRRAIAILPSNDKAHENLWIALQRKGDVDALMTAIGQAADIDTLSQRAKTELLRLGDRLMEGRDFDRSTAAYQEVLKRDPHQAVARTNIGVILLRQGNRELAIDQLQRAVRDDPDLFHARYNLGLALRGAGRTAEAAEQLEAAVKLNPDHAGARGALEQIANQAPSSP